MSKFIDVNTFEIVDNVFEVDDDIAETISILNKKGYRTTYCCSGHEDLQMGGYIYLPKEHFEVLKNMIGNYIIVGEQVCGGRDCYVALSSLNFPELYISFEEEYEFPTIPEGFEYCEGRISKEFPIELECCELLNDGINTCVKPGKFIPDVEAQAQIKQANLELLEWAKSLEYVNTDDINKGFSK